MELRNKFLARIYHHFGNKFVQDSGLSHGPYSPLVSAWPSLSPELLTYIKHKIKIIGSFGIHVFGTPPF